MKPSAKRFAKQLQCLAANIKRLRKEFNLTQMQLAEMVDIEIKYLQKLESGKKNPSIAIVLAIAEAFEADLNDLFLNIPLVKERTGRPRKKSSVFFS